MVNKMRNKASAQSLVELVNATSATDIRMVEVGSYAGESAEVFASLPQVKEIWCVDPWKSGYDPHDITSSTDFTEAEAAFDAMAAKHQDKVRKFKGTFQEFREAHPDMRPDLVYIDAEHTYEACFKDISTALEMKIRIISGHDYVQGEWVGVKKAVNDLLGTPDRVFSDRSWLKIMPQN